MAFVASRLTAHICRSIRPAVLRSSPLVQHRIGTASSHQLLLRGFATESSDSTKSTSSTPPPTATINTNGNEPALKLSESCEKKIGEICKNESYLRVLVDGGGCSGFQYKFELDTTVNDDDVRFGPDGRVLIDSISLDYCAGSTLDYSVELIKSGFRMVSNPKAEQGCSCGASFALKM